MQLLIFSLIFSLTIYISHSEVNLLIVKTEDNKLNATCVASGEDAVTPIMFYDEKYQAHIPHKSNSPTGYGTVRDFFTSFDKRYWISDISRTGRLFSDNKWTDFYYTKTSNVQIKSNLLIINGYELCLSIFLARCEYYCSFQLDLVYHGSDTRTRKYTKIISSEKEQLTYTFDVYVYNAELTITALHGNPYDMRGAYWAILAIAKCHKDGEIQVINAIYNIQRNVSCITLNSKHTILGNVAKDISECPWGYYGLYCDRICSEVLGPSRDSCQGVLSCTQDNKCKCNRGYWGGHCKNRCDDSKTNKIWSRLCDKSCGKCIGGSKCDVETGQCPSGCEDGFTGTQCLDKVSVSLKEPTEVESGFNYIKLRFNELEYPQRRNLEFPQLDSIEYKEVTARSWNSMNVDWFQRNNDFEIDNLKPETEYAIRGRYSNNNPSPITYIWTKCEDIIIDKVFDTFQANGFYTVTIKLLITAHSCSRTRYYLVVNSDRYDEINHEFIDVPPYTTLNIALYSKNNKVIDHTTHKTPEGIPEAVIHLWASQKGNAINVFWIEPQRMNGPLKHYVVKYGILKYLGITPEEDLILTEINIIDTYFTINDVIPYAKYQITVSAMNSYNRGSEKSITIDTKSAVPPAVQDFQVFSHSPNRIGLRWKPPIPPNGVIEYYKIEHCDSTSCKLKTAESSQCEVWEDYLCYTINKDIFEEYNYTIKISAKNKGVENFGPETNTTTETRYAKPSAPTNISVHLDDNNNILYVYWSHPVENGPVHNFEIHLVPIDLTNSIQMIRIMKVKNILKIYSEQFTNLNYSSKYRVCVRGNNEQIGKDECREIATKPAIPEFEHQPEIILNNDETFTVNIPSTKGRTNCSVLVIASKNEYAKINEKNIDLEKVQSDFNNTKFIENLSSANNKIIYNLAENVRANKTVYFTIILSNKYLNDYKHKIYKTMWDPYEKHNSNNLSYVYLLILLIIPIMLIITIYFIKKKKNTPHHIDEIEIRQQNRVNPLIEEDHSQPANYLYQNLPSRSTVQSSKVRNMKKMPEDIIDVESQRILDKRLNIDPNMSCLVKMTEFKNYVKQALENNELQRQHLLFPRGMVKPCEYGDLPENKAKNRYKNLTAYDDTRVILTEINGDPYSDYINANFIDGYNTLNAYICTQGPKSNTVNDFWRMIWEQNSTNIIMVANVVENGKKKCEEYWPKLNELKVYGEIRVKHDQTEVYADYVRRRFTVNFKTMKRTIEQLHFTSWPDHGVPMYPSLLVPLLKQMVTIPMPGPPVVVHCSAGVGRTGTIILCDICIRMAKIENSIDVLGQLYLMRANRTNLVDNFDQYKLVHLILLESLIVPVTNFPCNSTFINDIKRLVTTKALQKQIKVIEDNSWMDNAMKTIHNREGTHLEPENISKNRFQHILPDDNNELRISRWPYNDIHSDYINAVYVDGYRNKGQFIVTQQPMPNTLGDFWRMVLEKEAYVIVSLNTIDLNDETSVQFYPEKNDLMTPVPYLTIQNTKTELVGFYNQITLKLFDSSLSEVEPEKKSVIVVQLNDWAPTMLKPPGPIIPYVQLWETLERLSNNVKPIVVMCHDGATASGLFTALSFVIEKIKLEQECDVCLAVRTIRHNRKIFVKRIEQFEYLYKASIAYFNSFQLYSNFNSVNDPNLDA